MGILINHLRIGLLYDPQVACRPEEYSSDDDEEQPGPS